MGQYVKKIKSIRAWAIVDKDKPKLKVLEIYEDKDIKLLKGERLVRVEIKEITKASGYK